MIMNIQWCEKDEKSSKSFLNLKKKKKKKKKKNCSSIVKKTRSEPKINESKIFIEEDLKCHKVNCSEIFLI